MAMECKAALFGWCESTWDLFDKIGILLGLLLALGTIGSLLYGFIKRDEIRRWLNGNRFPRIGGNLEDADKYDGLVITVSKPETPAWVIAQVHPAWIGLIYTKESEKSAQHISEAARRAGVGKILREEIQDPDDPHDTHQAVSSILSRMKEGGIHDLAVDITGGKVPMSLGAFMAAEEHHAASLYVASTFDKELKRPDMNSARLTRISQPKA